MNDFSVGEYITERMGKEEGILLKASLCWRSHKK